MMNTNTHRSASRRKSAGFSMLEVLLAVAILSFALLALGALQIRLIKTSSDTKARAAATGLAQSQINRFRSIEQRDADDALEDYSDIIDGVLGDGSVYGGTDTEFPGGKITMSGTEFTGTWDVTGYSWDEDTSAFVAQADGTAGTNYKLVMVTVAWVDEAGEAQSVSIEDIVSSTAPKESGRAIASETTDVVPPIVGYEPQPAPEVVLVPTLGVGGDRFKETSKPLPDVLRNDFSTITTFSTVTFDADANGGFETVRREEFFVVNCVCNFSDTATVGVGRTPTVWDGSEYVVGDELDGKAVGKRVEGTVANFRLSGQPALCDTCCRDHHDLTSATDENGNDYPLYDPFRPDDVSSSPVDQNGDGLICTSTADTGCSVGLLDTNYRNNNHNHYFAPRNPLTVDSELLVANDTDGLYYEACRFVRVDGILRVAQDFNMRGFNEMPSSQLQTTSGLAGYQSYVVGFVEEYVDAAINLGSSYPQTLPDPAFFTGNGAPFVNNNISESDLPIQVLSRGIYVDFMTEDLLTCIKTRAGDLAFGDDTPVHCHPDAGDVLDITPFFEINVTLLSNWSQEGNAVVTNEAISDGTEETYSRGLATAMANGLPTTSISVVMENSNSGLTDSRKIDSDETTLEIPTDITSPFINSNYDEIILADAGVQEQIVVQGTLTLAAQVVSVTPSDVLIEGLGDALCTKPTDDTYKCIITPDPAFPDPTIVANLVAGLSVQNYGDEFIQGNNLRFEDNNVCPEGIGFFQDSVGEGAVGETTFVRFELDNPGIIYVDGVENALTLDLNIVTGSTNCGQDPLVLVAPP